MGAFLTVSIDLNKIDESKVTNHQNGARYYTLAIGINDQPDQYGNDVAVMDSQTAEERTAKAPKKYLGNGKVWKGNN